ncbi:hypothetical protein [Silvibacterium acidisoli]|uniref:hypothetical protein n=1 Tax=Acidobacteriaceae bacterium ZG23-2 TaxID=2883246 RepID=UPI00406C53A9
MRSTIRSIVFASAALCATAAFAADRAAINVPFSFDSHGRHFSAGRYEVSLDTQHNTLTMRNTEHANEVLLSSVSPAEYAAGSPQLRMIFGNNQDTHTLKTVQIEGRQAIHLDRTRHHQVEAEMAKVENETVLNGAE